MSEAWITWIIQGVTGLALGVIAWYMKRDREEIDKKVGKQEERIDRLVCIPYRPSSIDADICPL